MNTKAVRSVVIAITFAGDKMHSNSVIYGHLFLRWGKKLIVLRLQALLCQIDWQLADSWSRRRYRKASGQIKIFPPGSLVFSTELTGTICGDSL